MIGTVLGFLGKALGIIGDLIETQVYYPIFMLYDKLPFAASLTAWRAGFIDTYFHTYLAPVFVDLCISFAVAATFGPAVGSLVDLMGNIIAIGHFFENILAGTIFLVKGVIGLPIFIIVGLAPYVGPLIVLWYGIKIVWGILGIIKAMVIPGNHGAGQ